MMIELHLIQNFAPSCLNRDDTNAPKDCIFGGVRRARISSQCIKRAIRTQSMKRLLDRDDLAVRTKRLHGELVRRLIGAGKPEEVAAEVAETAIGLAIKALDKNQKTLYLLYLGSREIDSFGSFLIDNWEHLAGKKKPDKNALKGLQALMDGGKAADLALFGRMVADLPDINIDAACQVAHAISTHRVDMEMDYYTAVDDLLPDDSSGSDMIGTVEFNSACFYRYAVVYWEKLLENLQGDTDLARRTLEAFLKGSLEAIPTGKQNSFAAHNPPSLFFATVREEGMPWSLANAFERPVRADGKGLVKSSIEGLADYWERLGRMYGKGVKCAIWASLEEIEEAEGAKLGERKHGASEVIGGVLEALS